MGKLSHRAPSSNHTTPKMLTRLLLVVLAAAAPFARADDFDCTAIDDAAIDDIMAACEGEKQCTYGCQEGVEDALEDYGPKLDCTDPKFTNEYLAHELNDECLPPLLKMIMKKSPDYPCSLDDLMELGSQVRIEEVKEMICKDEDDDEDDDDA